MNSVEEAPEKSSSREKLWSLIFTTALAIGLGVFEELADPFGLDSQSDELSANMFNTITSPLYGAQSQVVIDDEAYPSRAGQADIIVLLIDDAYLEETNQSWPLAPRRYQRILRKLTSAGASAVFVDIYFAPNTERRRKNISRLYQNAGCLQLESACSVVDENWECGVDDPEAACIVESPRGGTEIVFASTLTDPAPALDGIQPPAAALAQMFADSNAYRMRQTAIDGKEYDTAGWALYKAWCRKQGDTCDAILDEAFPLEPMYLHWGYAPNRVMTDISDFQGQNCIRQADSLIGRLWQSLKVFGWNFFRGFSDSRIAPCPYHTQLKLQLFNNLSAEELEQLFADRIVIIGTSLKSYPDYQWSPVHEYIPGAFWHAMAVDNLIEFSDQYMRQSESEATNYLEPVGLLLIFLLQASLTRVIQLREEKEQFTDKDKIKIELDLMHGLFTICVISATVLLITGLLRWSPANWIGFAMLLFLIDFKPVTAVPRYCGQLLPAKRLTGHPFKAGSRYLAAGLMFFTLLISGYVILVFPHALILGQPSDAGIVSVLFIGIYLILIVFCLYKIIWGFKS